MRRASTEQEANDGVSGDGGVAELTSPHCPIHAVSQRLRSV